MKENKSIFNPMLFIQSCFTIGGVLIILLLGFGLPIKNILWVVFGSLMLGFHLDYKLSSKESEVNE